MTLASRECQGLELLYLYFDVDRYLDYQTQNELLGLEGKVDILCQFCP